MRFSFIILNNLNMHVSKHLQVMVYNIFKIIFQQYDYKVHILHILPDKTHITAILKNFGDIWIHLAHFTQRSGQSGPVGPYILISRHSSTLCYIIYFSIENKSFKHKESYDTIYLKLILLIRPKMACALKRPALPWSPLHENRSIGLNIMILTKNKHGKVPNFSVISIY